MGFELTMTGCVSRTYLFVSHEIRFGDKMFESLAVITGQAGLLKY
jgi:hypothetical protein